MDELSQELATLEAKSLRRRLRVVEEVLPGGRVRVGGQVLLNLSANDYLGLSQDPRIIEAAQARPRPGGAWAPEPPAWWWGTWVCMRRWRPGPGPVQGHRSGGVFQHRLHGQPGGRSRR